MPRTKFQEVVFDLMMVALMVYGMVCYNIAMDTGAMENWVFLAAFSELPIMGAIGFCLEFFLVGGLAKKLAFRLVTPGQDKPIFITLAISAITVCFMCPLMSFFATVLFKGGFNVQFVATWLQTTIMNFPMALCWQLFAAGPLIRLVFRTLFKKALAQPMNQPMAQAAAE